MTKLIKEAKRFQELAGIKEVKIKSIMNLADFLNANFEKFTKEVGKPQTKFTDIEVSTGDDDIKIATAGIDDDGMDISLDPRFKEMSEYNEIEEVEFLGKKLYIDNYLSPPREY
jgi:hypothetical protein